MRYSLYIGVLVFLNATYLSAQNNCSFKVLAVQGKVTSQKLGTITKLDCLKGNDELKLERAALLIFDRSGNSYQFEGDTTIHLNTITAAKRGSGTILWNSTYCLLNNELCFVNDNYFPSIVVVPRRSSYYLSSDVDLCIRWQDSHKEENYQLLIIDGLDNMLLDTLLTQKSFTLNSKMILKRKTDVVLFQIINTHTKSKTPLHGVFLNDSNLVSSNCESGIN